jgi:hypothetical protein
MREGRGPTDRSPARARARRPPRAPPPSQRRGVLGEADAPPFDAGCPSSIHAAEETRRQFAPVPFSLVARFPVASSAVERSYRRRGCVHEAIA